MIGLPLNDHRCLAEITRTAAKLVSERDEKIVQIAQDFPDTRALAAWIRELPQRDDLGDPADGPRQDACEPSQRLRIPAQDPNCVERAALYLATAELLDPEPVRQLATIDTPLGRHTIVVENGAPVIVDPQVTRNAAEGGLFRLESGPVQMRPAEAVDWIASLADEPAASHPHGRERLRCGHAALRELLGGRAVTARDADDVAFVLALAEREAQMFGPRGMAIVHCTITALSDLDRRVRPGCVPPTRRNAPEVRVGRYRVQTDLARLKALGRIGGRIGKRAGTAALRINLASLGIDSAMLREIERELNHEGLTLGELAKPAPMPGTLAAVTPDALAGRYLASRIG